MSDAQRAQLIHIDVDRRLGHEWDEWDGSPLPNQGNYDSPPSLFFGWSAVALAFALGVMALVTELLAPHIAHLSSRVPGYVWLALAVLAVVLWLWWGAILLSYYVRRPLLPERLAERGPFLQLMRLTSRVAGRFGKRDWVENAAVKVYLTADAAERARRRYQQNAGAAARAAALGATDDDPSTSGDQAADLAAVALDLHRRDSKDSSRSHAPLQAAADAVVIDSSELAVEETVGRVLALAQQRGIR